MPYVPIFFQQDQCILPIFMRNLSDFSIVMRISNLSLFIEKDQVLYPRNSLKMIVEEKMY